MDKEQYIRILSDFRKNRGPAYGISKMGIFGSVARGEQNKESDVDIYYEGNSLSLFKMGALKEELENLLNCPVDIVRIRESMNHLLKSQITKEGLYV